MGTRLVLQQFWQNISQSSIRLSIIILNYGACMLDNSAWLRENPLQTFNVPNIPFSVATLGANEIKQKKKINRNHSYVIFFHFFSFSQTTFKGRIGFSLSNVTAHFIFLLCFWEKKPNLNDREMGFNSLYMLISFSFFQRVVSYRVVLFFFFLAFFRHRLNFFQLDLNDMVMFQRLLVSTFHTDESHGIF